MERLNDRDLAVSALTALAELLDGGADVYYHWVVFRGKFPLAQWRIIYVDAIDLSPETDRGQMDAAKPRVLIELTFPGKRLINGSVAEGCAAKDIQKAAYLALFPLLETELNACMFGVDSTSSPAACGSG